MGLYIGFCVFGFTLNQFLGERIDAPQPKVPQKKKWRISTVACF